MKTRGKVEDKRPYEVVDTRDADAPGNTRCWFRSTAEALVRMRNEREDGRPWVMRKIGRDIERGKR